MWLKIDYSVVVHEDMFFKEGEALVKTTRTTHFGQYDFMQGSIFVNRVCGSVLTVYEPQLALQLSELVLLMSLKMASKHK